MKHLKIAALMAAGLAAVTLPAEAGGHEWWRSCGGHTYEGCDGIERGPYARHYRGHGSYGYRGRQVDVEIFHRRTHMRIIIHRRVIVPHGSSYPME